VDCEELLLHQETHKESKRRGLRRVKGRRNGEIPGKERRNHTHGKTSIRRSCRSSQASRRRSCISHQGSRRRSCTSGQRK